MVSRFDYANLWQGGSLVVGIMTSVVLISLVTLAYFGVMASEIVKGNYPMAVVFAGYAFANIGLILGVWGT